jgi:hypothetical protein
LLRPDFDADVVSGSREGSTSPSTRKRKKVSRRKSLAESNNLLGKCFFFPPPFLSTFETNYYLFCFSHFSLSYSRTKTDNHDQHSNSSSHSNNQQTLSTSATSAPSNNLSVTNNKNKTEQDANQDHHDNGDDEASHVAKRSKHGDGADNKQETELMIAPKNEYDDDDDEDADDNVEDLTMEDMDDDLDQPGPSHGGEGSSQGIFDESYDLKNF